MNRNFMGFLGSSVVKNLSANTGDVGLISGSRRSSGGGNGNLHQYFCLENSMDRGAWRATVHRVAKSCTRLSTAHTHIMPKAKMTIADCVEISGLPWWSNG